MMPFISRRQDSASRTSRAAEPWHAVRTAARPARTRLPLDALASAALERAAALGCSHAEVRVERIRSQFVALRDGHVRDDRRRHRARRRACASSATARSGFAATVELNADAAAAPRRRGRRAWRPSHVLGPGRARRAGRRARPRRRSTWSSPYEVDPTDRAAGRQGRRSSRTGARRLLARDVVDHVTRLRPGRGGGQALRRPVGHRDHPAPGPHPPRRRGRRRRRRLGRRSSRCAPWPRRSGGAGSTSPARAGTGTPSSAGSPTSWPRSWRRRRSRPGTYDLVIDPSNLWLTIHESVGHATELDRALGYEAAYAGHVLRHLRPARHPPLRLARHARRRATAPRPTASPPSATTTRVSRPSPSTSSATASSSATSSTGAWRPRTASAAPTAAPSPTRPCTSPSSAWPTSRSSPPAPGPGPTTEELIAGRRARHLRRRRQELVHRHAALQLPVHRPALLPHRPRPPGRPAARRRLPGQHHRLLGLARGRRRHRRPTCSAAPSTAARASPARWPRSATAVPRRSSAASTSSTPGPRRAGEPTGDRLRPPAPDVHRAGASSSSGRWRPAGRRVRRDRRGAQRGRRPLRQQHHDHQRRATRPPGHRRQLPRRRRRPAAGAGVARMAVGVASASGDVDVADLVRASEAEADGAAPADDACRRLAPPGAAGASGRGRRLRRAAGHRPSPAVLDGVVRALATPSAGPGRPATCWPGSPPTASRPPTWASSTGLRLRHVQPAGTLELVARSADGTRSAWAGAGTSSGSTTSTSTPSRTASTAAWPGPSAGSSSPPDATRSLLPPDATADLMVALSEAHVGPRRRGGPQRLLGARAAAPSSARPCRRCPSTLRSDPAEPGLESRAVPRDQRRRGPTSRSSTTASPSARTAGSSDGTLRRLRYHRAAAAPVGDRARPARGDNLMLELPGATATLDDLIAAHRAGAAAHLPLVHPRGRPGHAPAHRPHP